MTLPLAFITLSLCIFNLKDTTNSYFAIAFHVGSIFATFFFANKVYIDETFYVFAVTSRRIYFQSGFARLPVQTWDFKLLTVSIIKCYIFYVQSVHSGVKLDRVVTFRRIKHSELNDLLSN